MAPLHLSTHLVSPTTHPALRNRRPHHSPPHHTHHTWTPPQQTAQGHGRGRPHDAREHGELHQARGVTRSSPLSSCPSTGHVPTRSPTTQDQASAELAGRALGNFLRGVKQSGIIKWLHTRWEIASSAAWGSRRCLMTRRGTRMLCRTVCRFSRPPQRI